jgi:hypothetical protein
MKRVLGPSPWVNKWTLALGCNIRAGCGRMPGLLELSAPLLLLGLAVLPQALPPVFASILHHPIVSDYVHPIQAGGLQVTEPWVMARWWTPICGILYAFVGVGIMGAVWNIFRSHDRQLNICALCIGLIWVGVGAFSSLRFLPFRSRP